MSPRLPLTALFLASATTGCAGPADPPGCGGIDAPALLDVSDLTPALGASVPNDTIVHSFTVSGPVGFEDIALVYPDAHTAGQPSTALAFSYTPLGDGAAYAADPVTWETAPAHVEIDAPVVYESDDGCGYALPTPLFSYDVTPP